MKLNKYIEKLQSALRDQPEIGFFELVEMTYRDDGAYSRETCEPAQIISIDTGHYNEDEGSITVGSKFVDDNAVVINL